jgi:hypothetical protein
MTNQRLRYFPWRTTWLPCKLQFAVVSLRWFVISAYLPSFPSAKRCARLRLPYSGSLGLRFPTFPTRTSYVHTPSALCSATTAHRPSRDPSLVARLPIPCILLFHSCPVFSARWAGWSFPTQRLGSCLASVPHLLTYGKETMGSPKFPSCPCECMPRS